jgi:hypothetical protein
MKVELIYFNAGGGHRSAAKALETIIKRDYGWEVVLTNLFDVIDAKHLFKKITGGNHEDLYNNVVASGFTIGLGPQLKVLQTVIKAGRDGLVEKLRAHWSNTQPDLVVSVIPNFNRAIGESLSSPFATVITDMADLPPNFWIEPKAKNQHVIVGTEYAYAQAIVAGVPATHIHRTSGMILRPEFYDEVKSPGRVSPTGLVMFGGIGSKDMVPIAKALENHSLIFVCGKNEKLQKKLMKMNNPKHVVAGFVSDMPTLMAQADYFIGKPGPGSISEAIHMGLPVIVPLNSFTMPQERWNCQWVLDHEVGLVVRNFKQIDLATYTLLSRLDEYQKNAKSLNNRAIFEVPTILQKLM